MTEQKARSEQPVLEDRKRDWRVVYASRLAVSDLLVLVWVVFGVQIAWIGIDQSAAGFSDSSNIAVSYTAISVSLIVGWLLALGIYGTRGHRVVGAGAQEYKLIVDSTMRVFGVVAIVAFLFKVDIARGYILMALPLGLAVLILSRWMWRQWLGVARQRNRFVSTVVLVGSEATVGSIARELGRNPEAGYKVVGACISMGHSSGFLAGTTIPLLGGVDDALPALTKLHADTLVLTSSDDLSAERVRRLSWELEPGRQHLVVVPSLTDIGGPRIHTRPVAGLPLIHVETPRYEGAKTFTKRAFDLVVSLFLVVVLAPFFGLLALWVRLSSPGPVLFRQERVGLRGRIFTMLKFRSMVVDAESRLAGLPIGERGAGNHVMFKMRDDPRVTPVGRFFRRYSLDELPQLFNVVGGSMSLVGPRPPLESEVALYETHVHRRFLVKPGITGLWQVSGRSNLSWEDSVRLDLYYVENWSMASDLMILWRTAKAVFVREGAY